MVCAFWRLGGVQLGAMATRATARDRPYYTTAARPLGSMLLLSIQTSIEWLGDCGAKEEVSTSEWIMRGGHRPLYFIIGRVGEILER